MAEQPGDKMALNMEAELKSKAGSTGPEEFSMVVTVQGPPEAAKTPPRAVRGPGAGMEADAEGRGVDLVAVLDISDNMTADKLDDMKQAMYLLIKKLGEIDRLSIVTFNHTVKQVMPLTELAKDKQAIARSIIEELEVVKANGMDKESEAKALAAKVLEEREGEQKDRVGRVIFLSKGDDDDDDADAGKTKKARPVTAADSFLLGAGDSLSALTQSDGNGSVAFAFAKQSIDKMAKSMSGLKSVDPGKAVQIELQALDGVDISGIESGSNGLSLSGEAQKLITVFVPGLPAGGRKTFTLTLKVHDTKTTDFVCATGWCKRPNPKDEDDYEMFDYKLTKVDPRLPPPSPCWQARLANLLVPSPAPPPPPSPSVPSPPPSPPQSPSPPSSPSPPPSPPPGKKVHNNVDESTTKVPVGTTSGWGTWLLGWKKKQVNPPLKVKTISKEGPHHHRRGAWLPGLGAWLVGLGTWLVGLGTWLLSMLQIIPNNFKKIKWSKTYSWVLAVLLLGVGVAILIVPHPVPPPPPPPQFDISQHPCWPKMEASIALITLNKMEEAQITSSLRGASLEEITSAMNRYIYQALVHDTGLHVSLLQETVQNLEADTQELRVNIDTLAEEKARKQEKKEAVERANDTIADLKRQLAALLEKEAAT